MKASKFARGKRSSTSSGTEGVLHDVMYPFIGCGIFLCGVTVTIVRSAKSILRMADEGNSRRRFGHRGAFLAIKAWSKRMHRRSASRVADASLCFSTSTGTYHKVDERSHTTEADSLSSESSEYDVVPEQQIKGTCCTLRLRFPEGSSSTKPQPYCAVLWAGLKENCMRLCYTSNNLHISEYGIRLLFQYMLKIMGCELRLAHLACVAAQSGT